LKGLVEFEKHELIGVTRDFLGCGANVEKRRMSSLELTPDPMNGLLVRRVLGCEDGAGTETRPYRAFHCFRFR
jgi:hypothetical protein